LSLISRSIRNKSKLVSDSQDIISRAALAQSLGGPARSHGLLLNVSDQEVRAQAVRDGVAEEYPKPDKERERSFAATDKLCLRDFKKSIVKRSDARCARITIRSRAPSGFYLARAQYPRMLIAAAGEEVRTWHS
jgi:hypothetical protein